MIRLKHILVIVDPTASRHVAIKKGAALARQFQAKLELYVCDTKASRETRLAAQRARTPDAPLDIDLKPWLEALAQPLRVQGLDVSTDTEYAEVLHEGLLARTQRSCADLVVKDTHQHSLLRRTFITNTDWHLIRGCPVTLLLTKEGAWREPPRILAAVDPGHVNDKPAALDRRILEHSDVLARGLQGELHVAHAYLPVTLVAATTMTTPPLVAAVPAAALEEERAARLKDLHALAEPFKVDAARVHLDVGAASEYLPRVAGSLGIDVLAMGAVSRSGLQRIFIGHTAEAVLEQLPCDVLIVKPLSFHAD